MEPLDPELRGLVAAERAEVEPRAADRDRIARSLGARVGAGFGVGLGLLSTPAAGAAAAGGSALWLKLSAALVLSGAVAVVAVPQLKETQATAARSPSVVASPSAELAAPASPSPSPARAAEPQPATPQRVEPAASEAPPSRGPASASVTLPPLAEEARLLKQAQRALRDGQPAAALAALTQHQRRFPRGQLALERSAARVQALCGLGQTAQAQREGTAFLQQHPGSGLAAQVRASCGFATP